MTSSSAVALMQVHCVETRGLGLYWSQCCCAKRSCWVGVEAGALRALCEVLRLSQYDEVHSGSPSRASVAAQLGVV
jgi:hypothetical protein